TLLTVSCFRSTPACGCSHREHDVTDGYRQDSSTARRATSAAIATLALTLAAGCPARQVPKPTLAPLPDAARRSLAERDRLLTSLQTPVIMEYSAPSGHLKTREQLTVRRPASLRVDAMSPIGLALIVTADDAHIAVFNPSENTLIRGPAN